MGNRICFVSYHIILTLKKDLEKRIGYRAVKGSQVGMIKYPDPMVTMRF